MNKQKCVTNLIPDAPPDDDFFEGKAHLNLANSLQEIIETEIGGKTIGLEGTWGSGKSTVIKFLRKNLDSKNNLIFLFDAWAHDADPLRRTFLESFIEKVRNAKWVNEKNANKKIDELSGKIKKIDTKTTPILTENGKIAILLTFLTPILLTLVDHSIENILLPWAKNAGGIDYFFILSLMLYILPWYMLYKKAAKEEDFSFIIKDYENNKKTISIETPNPTSVEFEKAFLEIAKEALSEEKHKLIIVLDNLDRISKSDALNMLSILQTFLHHCQQSKKLNGDQSKKYLERLWVIIPYDRSGLCKILDENGNKNNASHILEKRFQIQLRVPPLILSNWRDYLFDLMKTAMPGHASQNELEKIYQIINLTWKIYNPKLQSKNNSNIQTYNTTPTPRQLISLVNQIGAIHRQWCEKGIPFSHIVFYTTFRYLNPDENLEDTALFTNEFPEASFSPWFYDEKNEIWESIATLWYNIDTKLACQILFRLPIINALISSDCKKLSYINEKTTKFWEIIRSNYGAILAQFNRVEDYLNAFYCVNECKMFTTIDLSNHMDFLEIIQNGILKTNINAPLTMEIGEKIRLFLSYRQNENLFNKTIDILNTDVLEKGKESYYNPETILGWVNAYLLLFPVIQKWDKDFSPIVIPGDDYTKLTAITYLIADNSNQDCLSYITPIESEQFFNNFEKLINDGLFSKSYTPIIDYINNNYVVDTSPWKKILNLIDIRINSQVKISEKCNLDEIIGLYSVFWKVMSISEENKRDGEKIIKNRQVVSGDLLNYLIISAKTDHYEDTASILFYYLAILPNCQQPSQWTGKSREGFDHIKNDLFKNPEKHNLITKKFIDKLYSENRVDLLFTIWLSSNDSRKWISYCLYLISKNSRIKKINPQLILDNWLLLKENLEDKWQDFLGSILKRTGILDLLKNEQFNINQVKIYQDIINYNKTKKIHTFGNKILKEIKELGKDTWYSELLKPDSNLFALLTDYHKNLYKIDLGLVFVEALIDYGNNLLTGKVSNCINSEYFKFIGNENERKQLHSKLINKLIELKNGIPTKFINCFGKEIMDKDVISNENDFINNCIIPSLERKEISCLKWFNEFLEKEPGFFIISEGNFSLHVLKMKISTMLKEELEEELRKILTDINTKLK